MTFYWKTAWWKLHILRTDSTCQTSSTGPLSLGRLVVQHTKTWLPGCWVCCPWWDTATHRCVSVTTLAEQGNAPVHPSERRKVISLSMSKTEIRWSCFSFRKLCPKQVLNEKPDYLSHLQNMRQTSSLEVTKMRITLFTKHCKYRFY